MSKNQIDKLGTRLTVSEAVASDLELLDAYRRSYSVPYDKVVTAIQEKFAVELTGRPAKSTSSIVEKLRRESIRLTQMQDIAGCRVTVPSLRAQDELVAGLMELFPTAVLVDRRATPSHGYRAVHVIVECDEKPVEIQIRTRMQHLWAELSEKFSDVVDPSIKYGGGDSALRDVLAETSVLVGEIEQAEKEFAELMARILPEGPLADKVREATEKLSAKLEAGKAKVVELIAKARALVDEPTGGNNAVSD